MASIAVSSPRRLGSAATVIPALLHTLGPDTEPTEPTEPTEQG